MKKLILMLVLCALIIPWHVRAAGDVYGFGDGKYYDVTGALKYFCFMDGNCFDMAGALVDMSAILGAEPQPSYTQAVYAPYPDTPTPVVQNPNQSAAPVQSTIPSSSQPIGSDTPSGLPQDPSLIDTSTLYSNCQISVTADNISIMIKTLPDATVTLEFDGAEVQPTDVEQGLATKGLKDTLFSEDGLAPGSDHSYSLQVETSTAWDVKTDTITTKAK